MEKIADSADQASSKKHSYNFSLNREHIQKELERIRQEGEERTRQRREGRKKGEITQPLREKLENCNILQLKRIIRICRRRIQFHKLPPTEEECRLPYVVHVFDSITIRNKRFQIELRRNSARAKKLYVNGPYVRAYWRDGRYLGMQNYGKDRLRQLPRKVLAAYKRFLNNPDVEDVRTLLQTEISRTKRLRTAQSG